MRAFTLPCLVAALMSFFSFPTGSTEQREGDSPADVIQKMFDSLTSGDLDAYNSTVTSDFFLFDVGERLTKEAFFDVIKKAKAKGHELSWAVTKPEVHIAGDIAWITYTNKGVFKGSGKSIDHTWLESAILERDKTWKIRFLHSTTAKATP